MAHAGRGETEYDGTQLGLLQPLRYQTAKHAAARFSQGVRQMIAVIRFLALAGNDEHGLAASFLAGK